MGQRILFVTSAHPDGRGVIGAGEGICGASLRTLLDEGHTVHVLCLASPAQFSQPALAARCASYTTLAQTRWQTIRALVANLGQGSWMAPWLFTRVSPAHVRAVRGLCARHAIDRVWLDFPSSLGFAAALQSQGLPIDYFVHDVVSQKMGRRRWLSLLQPAVQAVERHLLAHVQRCLVLSEKDAVLLRQMAFVGPVAVRPPQQVPVGEVPGALPAARLLAHFDAGKHLVFFGNMARPENHGAMLHFLLQDFQAVRRAHPDAVCWVLGLGPRWTLRCLARLVPGVRVVGAVDDPTPVFARATLCIAPLHQGAGVKIKVLQMLQAGARVVATPVGAEGIAATPNLQVVEPREFAQAVIAALHAPAPHASSASSAVPQGASTSPTHR